CRVDERIVVERRVALQVIGRRGIAGVGISPGLLQRDAEQRYPPYPVAHDLEEVGELETFLHVIRQVKVRVVQHRLCGIRRWTNQAAAEQGPENEAAGAGGDGVSAREPVSGAMHRCSTQNRASRLVWKTQPL